MKIYRSLLVVVATLTASLLASGCSSLLISSGKPVTQYLGTGPDGHRFSEGVTRDEVIKQFGAPATTKSFAPPISLLQARSERIVPFFRSDDHTGLSDTLLIGGIDEFRIHGPVQDMNAVEGYHITRELAFKTLGLSELVCFPLALYGYLGELNCVTRIYVVYYPDGTVLYQSNDYNVSKNQLNEGL
jgi:hypothetical protein